MELKRLKSGAMPAVYMALRRVLGVVVMLCLPVVLLARALRRPVGFWSGGAS